MEGCQEVKKVENHSSNATTSSLFTSFISSLQLLHPAYYLAGKPYGADVALSFICSAPNTMKTFTGLLKHDLIEIIWILMLHFHGFLL